MFSLTSVCRVFGKAGMQGYDCIKQAWVVYESGRCGSWKRLGMWWGGFSIKVLWLGWQDVLSDESVGQSRECSVKSCVWVRERKRGGEKEESRLCYAHL